MQNICFSTCSPRDADQSSYRTAPDTAKCFACYHHAAQSRVDDFALRKGTSYWTILVDLEHHQSVDLLPDRTAETLARWLQAHPGVEMITRHQAKEYIEGASQGAPRRFK